jgi:hypothetical protein
MRFAVRSKYCITPIEPQTHAQSDRSTGGGDGGDIFRVYLVKDAIEILG